MLSKLKQLLSSKSDKSNEGVVYFGADDAFEKKPDENGKKYNFFNLILEGDHKGKYSAGLVASKSNFRNNFRDAEALDIHESGYEIYAPDPFN
jgi:hypothetical protein